MRRATLIAAAAMSSAALAAAPVALAANRCSARRAACFATGASFRPARIGEMIARSEPGSEPSAIPLGAEFARSAMLSASVVFGGVPGAAPTVPVGVNPVSVAVDPVTHTVYVGNGDATVSVINEQACPAIRRR